jgi:hypothetical protein
MFFASPAFIISHAAAETSITISSTCGSIDTMLLGCSTSGVWMRLVVQLATTPIGYVGIELGRGEIGVAEHLLDGAEVGAALEQVRGERVAQEVRVDARRVETRLLGELAEDQERTGAGERAPLRVQEELGTVAAVEVRAAA